MRIIVYIWYKNKSLYSTSDSRIVAHVAGGWPSALDRNGSQMAFMANHTGRALYFVRADQIHSMANNWRSLGYSFDVYGSTADSSKYVWDRYVVTNDYTYFNVRSK